MREQLILNEMIILNEFYSYLRDNKDECAIDLINEFCYEKNINVEELGMLIAEDKILKEYVKNNLKTFKYIRENSTQLPN